MFLPIPHYQALVCIALRYCWIRGRQRLSPRSGTDTHVIGQSCSGSLAIGAGVPGQRYAVAVYRGGELSWRRRSSVDSGGVISIDPAHPLARQNDIKVPVIIVITPGNGSVVDARQPSVYVSKGAIPVVPIDAAKGGGARFPCHQQVQLPIVVKIAPSRRS